MIVSKWGGEKSLVCIILSLIVFVMLVVSAQFPTFFLAVVQEELSLQFFCVCCYLLFFFILDTVSFLSGVWLCGHGFAYIQSDHS